MRPYRTVLEQKIRERKQTFEEFAAYVETFAREHNEPGTLSVRHLQRLVAGRRSDGRPLGEVHVVTARLLESILGAPIEELLAPPTSATQDQSPEMELLQRFHAASQVDDTMVTMLRDQLDVIRHIDRQLGATTAHDEVVAKASQVSALLSYSMTTRTRQRLASLLSELYCLAGWQALDLGRASESWRYYDLANSAALESGNYSYKALAEAGRAFVLVDVGKATEAAQVVSSTRQTADRTCSHLTRSWLAAAQGEVFAATHLRIDSLKAFDQADALLTNSKSDVTDPYMALDAVHLGRWRGHALARCDDPDAVEVLTKSLRKLDRKFARAEAALRVDLAYGFAVLDEPFEVASQTRQAGELASRIGSVRQQRRIAKITAKIGRT